MQGNTGEYKGIQENTGEYKRIQGNTREHRRMQGIQENTLENTRESKGKHEEEEREA